MGDLSTDLTNSIDIPTVLVTGFGPFGGHQKNASWIGVQEMAKKGLGDNVRLIIQELPVEYKTVSKVVPELWKKYKPQLVVHVGVSSIATEITLEQQAHNDNYNKDDVIGQCPQDGLCVRGCQNTLSSCIDMAKVQQAVNSSINDITAMVSYDPGRYLCDFVYFTSLNICQDCSAFIHVPPVNKPYSEQELGEGLRVAVLAMLQQVLKHSPHQS